MIKVNLLTRFSDSQVVVILVLSLLVVFESRCVLAQSIQREQSISQDQLSHAVIESAIYEATFSESDFTNGTFRWNIIHRGSVDATIDFSNANLALSNLKSESTSLAWGTTTEDRRVLIVEKDSSIVTGGWSKHGDVFPGMSIIECQFPPALKTQLMVRIPTKLKLRSSVGHVESKADGIDSDFRIWRVDLGRHRTATFSVTSNDLNPISPNPKVEVYAVHVARRDGIFIQADFSIEGYDLEHRSEIEFQIPKTLAIQSITSSGVPVEYDRKTEKSSKVTVNLPKGIPKTRINLRIQGFQPVQWVLKHSLPFLSIPGSIEAKRAESLRVETPLELHQIESQGFFQVGLSKEPRGEVWRFEAYRADPKLTIDLGAPNSAVRAEIHSLHYLDTPLPWSVSKISVTAKSGRLFDLNVTLPRQSTVISVLPTNIGSEIASWSVNRRTLNIVFKEPISFDSRKTFEILFRSESPSDDIEQQLPVPVVASAVTTSIQCDWVLPASLDIHLVTGTRWNELTSEMKFDQFLKTKALEIKKTAQTHRSFFNSNVNTRSLPEIRISPTREFDTDRLDNSEPDEVSTGLDAQDPAISATPSARVLLLTQAESLSNAHAPQLVHHATIQVHGECGAEKLQLHIPEDCLLSSVSVDGKAITVFHDGDFIRFPEEITTIREVTLIYISKAEKKWLAQSCKVPLPKFSLEVSQFDWTLEIPEDQVLTRVSLPNSQLETNHQRLPWGSFSMNPRTWGRLPQSESDTISSEPPNLNSTDRSGSAQFEFHSMSFSSEVQFESWDAGGSRNFAWAAFLGAMIVGAGGRLFRSLWIRKTIIYWIFVLVVIQFFAVNQWSMIIGAMLTGTFISLLVPFELLQHSDREQSSIQLPNLSTVTVIFMLLSGCTLFAQDRSPRPSTSSQRANAIPYLLRSVRYDLLDTTPTKQYRATIEILTPTQNTETLVELSYKGVVFQSGAKCLIDGREETVIPALDGKGVVVRIQNDPEETTNAPDLDWQRHLVQFHFLLRKDETRDEENVSTSTIPRVLDSILSLPRQQGQEDVVRDGQILSSNEETTLISLGAVDTISAPINHFENHDKFKFYTLLNVSPARVTGQLYIEDFEVGKDSQNETRKLNLKLPQAVLVTNVSGASVSKWFLTEGKTEPSRLIIECRKNAPRTTTVVSFCLPTMVNSKGEVLIPKLNWSDLDRRQTIGLKGPTGVSLDLVKEQVGYRVLSAESWPQNEVFGRNRPSQILEMTSASDLQVVLKHLRPDSQYSVSEDLIVERSTLSWKADIEVKIEALPIFVHEMKIQGNVRINNVETTDSGEKSSLRFHQDGDQLAVFIPGGHLGTRQLHLTGEIPFASETFHDLPEITVTDSILSKRSLTIKDRTNWDIELEMPGGTKFTELSLPSEEFQAVRNIGVFLSPIQTRPAKIRLRPPQSATRVDLATRLQISDQKRWNLVQLLRFSSDQAPLKKVEFSIPRQLENVRIGPRGLRIDRVENENFIDVTIQVPKRLADDVTIQIFSRLTNDFQTKVLGNSIKKKPVGIPEIRVRSAQTASRFFFLNENRLVTTQPSISLPIEAKDLPRWIPPEWKNAADKSDLIAFQLLEQNAQLVPKIVVSNNQHPLLSFVETTIWPQSHRTLSGATRLWLTQTNSLEYALPFKTTVSLTHAFLPDGRELIIKKSNGKRTIDIEVAEQITPITILWKSKLATSNELFSPLVDSVSDQPQHLIGIAESGAFLTTIPVDQRLTPIDIWIYRWQSLLDIAEKLHTPLSVESALHQDLRECQIVVQELASKSPLSSEHVSEIDKLKRKWSTILAGLTIEASAVTTDLTDTTSSFGLLQDVENEFQKILWVTTESADLSAIKIVEHRNWPLWMVWFSSLIAIVIASAILFRLRKTVARWAKYCEQDPALGLFILGMLWLLFLQPKVISLFICLAAAALYWLKLSQTPIDELA